MELEDKIQKLRAELKELYAQRAEKPMPEVKQLRLQLGLSQSELATATGCNIFTLRNWEQGSIRTPPYFIKLLQAMLDKA